MYKIIKDVINSGKYSLADMIKKIDTIWIQGDITEDQKNELKDLATSNAPREEDDNEFLKRIVGRIEILEKRCRNSEKWRN